MIARSLVAACLLCCCFIAPTHAETGIASVYAYAGGKTASGERANPRALTAAHRTLPFGSTRESHQQEKRPRRCRPHQRSRSLHARAHHRCDAGCGASARIWRARSRHRQLDVTKKRGDQRGWAGTSTRVQPDRPISTQSWSLRICAMTSAIQMPVTISATVTASPSAFMVMRWRKSSGSSGARSNFSRSGTGGGLRHVSRKHRAARTKRQDSAFGFARRWSGHELDPLTGAAILAWDSPVRPAADPEFAIPY